MQSLANFSRAVVHVVFRGGSAQRIHHSNPRMLFAVLALLGLSVSSQVFVFGRDAVETGLYLFTLLSGLYIAAALLTRRAPRPRLRVSLLGTILTVSIAHLPLMLLAATGGEPAWLLMVLSALAVCIAVSGMSSCVRFALGGSRARAVVHTVGFIIAIGAFYGTMYPLIQIVFA